MGVEKKYISKVSLVIVLIYILYLLSLRYKSRIGIEVLKEDLKRVYSQIKLLKRNHILILKQYSRLFNDTLLQNLQSEIPLDMLLGKGPTDKYEKLRRNIYSNTKELWYYFKHQLSTVHNASLSLKQRQYILDEVAHRKRWLLTLLEKVPALDGYEEWRRREAASVSDLVQRKLFNLQNPRDCRTAKTLICKPYVCGFGCAYHHLMYCLATAYDLGRVMQLPYMNRNADKFNEYVFKPLSDTCVAPQSGKAVLVTEGSPNESVLYVPPLKVSATTRHYRIPKDLALRLVRFHDDPYAWWVGQLLKFIMKLRRPDIINALIERIDFTSPIVGVHIRRTDKITEAPYHGVEEYMSHVDDYYAQLELTRRVRRRIYLATDDVNVLIEVIAKYPQYMIYGDYFSTKSATVKARTHMKGMNGIMVDLHMLATCDHVVCTFSSNIGRMIYELMQTKRLDAAARFTTLDDKYYLTLGETRHRIAVMRNSNVSLEIGDLIKYEGNTFNYGIVLKTNKTSLFPWFKTEEEYISYPYPEFT